MKGHTYSNFEIRKLALFYVLSFCNSLQIHVFAHKKAIYFFKYYKYTDLRFYLLELSDIIK